MKSHALGLSSVLPGLGVQANQPRERSLALEVIVEPGKGNPALHFTLATSEFTLLQFLPKCGIAQIPVLVPQVNSGSWQFP